MDLLSVLPNLSIGVVSVLALVYVTLRFIQHLNTIHTEHMTELKEREHALRAVEVEVRQSITSQLVENTKVMTESNKVLERALHKLDHK